MEWTKHKPIYRKYLLQLQLQFHYGCVFESNKELREVNIAIGELVLERL